MTTNITELLQAAGRGDQAATEALWHVVYAELRALAARQLAKESDEE